MRASQTVTGTDRLRTGLVGAGIGPSLSPALHEREADALGLPLRYDRWDLDAMGVDTADVGTVLDHARAAGYRGLNVTHPAKQAVIAHLDGLSPDAAAIGAVNTVVIGADGSLTGHNTDWTGFRDGLRDGLPGVRPERVVLLGAGGAGAAAGYALAREGVRWLHVVDVDGGRATALAAALAPQLSAGSVATGHGRDELEDLLPHAGGLVHATPVGMAAHPGSPCDAALLAHRPWVAEIVYRPLDTALLADARAAGCRTVDGGRMVVHQAAEAFRLFTGRTPDTGRMLGHLAELVGAEQGCGHGSEHGSGHGSERDGADDEGNGAGRVA
ncbi:shikimate dehydrogenase [Pseudonocardia endophytica]|uniref:Shikimate dehydrogenase n=1 Tax=Pseudonocardia endophytica TaxID=401976 RepID=A0A4R1HR72_PSEEN|nr:shikimate dehydrogenase [Pseudonocardia endophytica]TCK23010.1 shikimate dehydrogenase [Pseudonocardia endophytica]